jgi:hypothetical protein
MNSIHAIRQRLDQKTGHASKDRPRIKGQATHQRTGHASKDRPRIKGQHLVNFTDHEMAWQGLGITQRYMFLKDKKQ